MTNFASSLNRLDWFVFFFILALTISVVLLAQLKELRLERKNTLVEHLLMGRRLTLPLFVATLVSTWYGGIFGTAQIAFESGIYNFITQGVFWYAAYLIFAFFILKKARAHKAMTLPDMIGKMFGPKSEKLSAVFNLFNLVPIAYAISIGLIIQMFFPLTLNQGIAIGVSFTLLYAMFGGLRAVVFSDLVQFSVMLSSVVFLFGYSLFFFGLEPLERLPESYFSLTGGHGIMETLAWGFIAFATLADPNFYQRSFAASSDKTAKYGIIISTVIWMIFDLSLTFGAMYAKAMLPLGESSNGYFEYAFRVLPQGLRGFFLAGICATVLSTLDSYLFLGGSTLAYDLAPKKYKNNIYLHYLSFIFVAALAIIMATLFEGNIKEVWKTLGGLSAASLLLPLIYGHFSKHKLQDGDFVFICLTSASAIVAAKLFGFHDHFQIDELYIGMLVSAGAIALAKARSSIKAVGNKGQ